jgi:hypothetical protein
MKIRDQLELAKTRGAAPGSSTLMPPNAVPHPRSVEGAFYVANDICLACDFPHVIAPDLIGYESESPDSYHCFFKRQPETAGEVGLAVEALVASCCSGLRYRGSDLNVIAAILNEWAGSASEIDLLTTEDSQQAGTSNGG